MVNQAGATPGPEPQQDPTQSTGSKNRKGNHQGQKTSGTQPRSKSPSVHSDDSIVFAHWNADGIFKKKPDLQVFLKKHGVDIICVQETHLADARKFFVRGYQVFRHDRANRHKGGLITLVKNAIPAVRLSDSQHDYLESLAVKLIFSDTEHMTVVNCYAPPGKDKELKLHKIPVQENKLLIMGDFNGRSPSWGYEDRNARGENIEDWMLDSKLVLINSPDDKPTCLSRAWNTTSHPDLAMATEDVEKQCTKTVEDQLGGSDHRPILIHVKSSKPPHTARKTPSWNYKKANWSKYAELTDKFTDNAGISENVCLDQNVSSLTSAIMKAALISVPRGRRADYKPYWSQKLEDLQQRLSEARDQLEIDPSPEQRRVYTKAKDMLEKEKETQQRKSWKEKTESLNMERDMTKLWKLTKTINEDTQANRSPVVLEEENQHYSGKLAANILATNFSQNSSLNIPREQVADMRNETRHERRKAAGSPSMSQPFSTHELKDAIRKLKNKKSPGKDGITNEMIKKLGNGAKQKLLDVFNQSWTSGVFPSAWKEAIMVPIPKKGKDKTKKNSYRPISLLSCIGKTMERMVNKRLLHHLEKNNLITSAQSAFRKHRSTEDQIAYLTQEIENNFQDKENQKTLAVFIDLEKAFDKVWKEGLLLKLLKKNVSGKMFTWIESYLFKRSARVKLDGETSNLVKIREGVPQGGVISPTLFLVFIDDITENLSRHISRALHADDLAIWTAAKTTASAGIRLQEALDSISLWANKWFVQINQNKTEATCFSLSTSNEEDFTLLLNGEKIKKQDTPKYLGVKLDKRLTWNAQISDMVNKSTRKLAIMKKLAGSKWGANKKVLKQVYTGAVRPHLEYASSSWTTAAKTNTGKLDKVQNAGLRLITGGIKTTPVSAMEKEAQLHSLEERRQEKTLRQGEKMKRLPTHPLSGKLGELTKNRLKRKSINHISKALQRENQESLPQNQQNVEPLQDYEEWDGDDLKINLEVPSITTKENHSKEELKNLTLELMEREYPSNEWTHVYTDGSADQAVKNGGAGVLIRFPNGESLSKFTATGRRCTNFRAEACALKEAATSLNQEKTERLSASTVFLTDCTSLLQSLQGTNSRNKILKDIRTQLALLSQKTTLTLQWIPSHCGIGGNEEADKLAKKGSEQTQEEGSTSYAEQKQLLKTVFHNKWKERLHIGLERETDALATMTREQQVQMFRLRTGHCGLLAHLYRIGRSHTDQCPCGTGVQDVDHLLQTCPTYKDLRQEHWPEEVALSQKLWGPPEDLHRTTDFTAATKLQI